MIGLRGRRPLRDAMLVLLATLLLAVPAAASRKPPRIVAVLPLDAGTLARDEQWLGEGVAQLTRLALAQHPGVVTIERARLRALGPAPDVWNDAAATQAVRTLKLDAAFFGQISKKNGTYVVQPRVVESKSAAVEPVALEPVTIPEGELLSGLGAVPILYAKSLRVAVSDAEQTRMEKAARPTRSLRALELFSRGQMALARGGQEGTESAVDLFSRAIEADPNFVAAQYTLGTVHQSLGNRWKAAAQYRAAAQLDATAPEPLKALGDLFLSQPRRLFDQAVEAYAKAIELRPFYADAHVGLGDARAAKGEIDAAIKAYQQALVYNPVNPKVHLALGKIYYLEKNLYYEAVTAYQRAIELDPHAVEARMGLGEVYEEKGLYKEALEEYKRVMELDPKHTGALYNLALVYEKIDPREAIVQWERYIELASQLPSEKDWVGVARQHLRKLRNQLKE